MWRRGFSANVEAGLQPRPGLTYPDKPVRLVEPFGAGGGVDGIARAVARKLSETWRQPVTVDNHPGAGSTAAPALVARSARDGYTRRGATHEGDAEQGSLNRILRRSRDQGPELERSRSFPLARSAGPSDHGAPETIITTETQP
jgi:hypothetical protein